ncbi:MAG TPA: hypothetical protein VFU05_15525 [Cyclobacteriaceae bacterium]|nr:hypothetical protein [Cyclobacteriaceae bacterium]
MKNFIVILLLIVASNTVNGADKYDNGKLIFTDGTSRVGWVETSMGDDYINFKSSKTAEPEKVPAEKIKTIVYLNDDGKTTEIEYDRIKVYLGWKQTRISDFGWYQVVERGIATLYVKGTTMQGSIYNPNSVAGFQDYFIIRADEPAAKMIANIAGANNNQTYRAKAPLYFADYPELAKKIETKEYTWKDLLTSVKEYNTWAASKKKK